MYTILFLLCNASSIFYLFNIGKIVKIQRSSISFQLLKCLREAEVEAPKLEPAYTQFQNCFCPVKQQAKCKVKLYIDY